MSDLSTPARRSPPAARAYAAAMRSEAIEYSVPGDDTLYVGHLAYDDSHETIRPAVLVCHEGPGLSPHVTRVADRLASLGYVAFALDYHGGGLPLPRDEMIARLVPLMNDPDTIRLRARAGLDQLLGQSVADPSQVAAIGYCFGGTMALELARSGADLAAVVGFHSGLATARPDDAANITAAVLVLIGTEDPLIPPEQRSAFEAEMRTGGVDWRMNLYGGAAHSFTNTQADEAGIPGVAYDEHADKRSWRAMLDLFDEVFTPIAH